MADEADHRAGAPWHGDAPLPGDPPLDADLRALLDSALTHDLDVDTAARHLWSIHGAGRAHTASGGVGRRRGRQVARSHRAQPRRRAGQVVGARQLVAAVAALALVTGSSAALAHSGAALPGDALYPVKRGLERAHLVLIAVGEDAQAAHHLSTARSRLAEAEALAERRPAAALSLLEAAAASLERADGARAPHAGSTAARRHAGAVVRRLAAVLPQHAVELEALAGRYGFQALARGEEVPARGGRDVPGSVTTVVAAAVDAHPSPPEAAADVWSVGSVTSATSVGSVGSVGSVPPASAPAGAPADDEVLDAPASPEGPLPPDGEVQHGALAPDALPSPDGGGQHDGLAPPDALPSPDGPAGTDRLAPRDGLPSPAASSVPDELAPRAGFLPRERLPSPDTHPGAERRAGPEVEPSAGDRSGGRATGARPGAPTGPLATHR